MKERLDLDPEAEGAGENPRKELPRRLDRPLRPALLLALEGAHRDRNLRGRDHVGQEHEAETRELSPIGKIHVFGQRVVLPPAPYLDGLAAPEPGGAVEIEEGPGAVAPALLPHAMGVEKTPLDSGQEPIGIVDMSPAGLDHPHLA